VSGTRKVRMLVGVSGYRHDDRKWPPAGETIDVPGWEADDLIRGGNAIAVPAGSAPDPEPGVTESRPPSQIEGEALAAEAEAGAAQADSEDGTGAGDSSGSGDEDPDDGKPEGRPSAPAPSAPKQDWIDFAVQVHGADVHAATGMTKADLMSRYGGRL